MKMRRRRGHGQQHQRTHRNRMKPRVQQSNCEPSEDGRENCDGAEEKGIESAEAMDACHRNFAEPLVRHPPIARERERVRIAANEAVRENAFAGSDVPESAGIAKEVRAATGEQEQPDREKREGTRTHESLPLHTATAEGTGTEETSRTATT